MIEGKKKVEEGAEGKGIDVEKKGSRVKYVTHKKGSSIVSEETDKGTVTD